MPRLPSGGCGTTFFSLKKRRTDVHKNYERNPAHKGGSMEDRSDKLVALIRAGHIKQARELCEALGTTVGAELHNVTIRHHDIGERAKSGRTKALCQIANEATATGKLCEFYNVEHSEGSLRGEYYRLSERVELYSWKLSSLPIIRYADLYGGGERVKIGPRWSQTSAVCEESEMNKKELVKEER